MWALLALLFGQIALAEHSASHIDQGFSQEIVITHSHHDEHQHGGNHNKHECPECVLTQSLQAAFYNVLDILLPSQHAEILRPTQQYVVVSIGRYKAHPTRAPPVILI